MRIVTGLALLFAIIFGLMIVPEISDLQDIGEGISGLAPFFENITFMVMALIGAIAVGSVAVFLMGMLNRR